MQHEYTATVAWTRNGEVFSDGRYSRGHVWRFDGGIEVAASSSPSVVPLPMSREDAVDPEEAFVAALSSCHMLTFLAIAGKKRFIVDRYEDKAVGIMTKNAERQTLRLEGHARSGHRILRRQDTDPPSSSPNFIISSHQECFIANSVLTDVVVAGIPSH